MNKVKVIGTILVVLIFVGLVIFASTKKFEDSHLRVDGIRVKVANALIVDGCDEQTEIYCKKNIVVNGKNHILEFEFLDFRENGYPNTISATIDNKEFYHEEGLKIEEVGSVDYKVFLNFNVFGDYITFTYTAGTNGRTTTLYAIDTEGNIVLEEYEIDKDNMLIKDYTEFLTYEDNKINIYATRVIEDINYQGENICLAPKNDIVEAHYTYTYKDGKFKKKQTSTTTAEQFIEEKEILCANKDE